MGIVNEGFWSLETKKSVWAKAEKAGCENEKKNFLKDQCGAWISWDAYGDRSSPYGWEIDPITARGNGGGDNLGNLRPLHWKNNASREDGRLSCVVKSAGNKNVGL